MDTAATQTGQMVQKMIDKPTDAWMAALPILFIVGAVLVLVGMYFIVRYVMQANHELTKEIREDARSREDKFFAAMTSHGEKMGDLSSVVSKQTETLVVIKDEVCRVRDEVDDIKSFLNWKEGKAS
jgi:hypothetical protein